jgi:hypothetical protein
MVCPVCVLPFLGTATAVGGSIQAQKESEKEYRWFYWLLVLFGLALIVYWLWWRSQPAPCGSCKFTRS